MSGSIVAGVPFAGDKLLIEREPCVLLSSVRGKTKYNEEKPTAAIGSFGAVLFVGGKNLDQGRNGLSENGAAVEVAGTVASTARRKEGKVTCWRREPKNAGSGLSM